MLDESFAGRASSLAEVRAAVAATAESAGLDRAWTEKAMLVTNELAANALEASPDLAYRVRIERRRDDLVITVGSQSDAADLPPRDEWGPSSRFAHRGRGLAIVDAIADRVEIAQNGDGWLEISALLRPFADR